MSQSPVPTPVPLPRPLRTARVILWIQAVCIGLLTVLQFAAIAERQAHNQEVGGFNSFAVVDNILVFVLALTAALFVAKRRFGRTLALVVEALGALNGILNLVNGATAGIVEIGFAVGVASLLLNPQVTLWYKETITGPAHN
ncbi:hypothetical protein [Kutzneria sp. CA-103260]|uniref:hypothetical protein n=1 Tax=Kutzneria sp. CA-103260 TaxID=2802641 RepID=UPI001BABB69F|nr:hypothetical protein [Kutzneria sp. CA-103260]QUQ63998.1 hypothetical protein JJ691_17180 [Kutzneria sp. CA-103260]